MWLYNVSNENKNIQFIFHNQLHTPADIYCEVKSLAARKIQLAALNFRSSLSLSFSSIFTLTIIKNEQKSYKYL